MFTHLEERTLTTSPMHHRRGGLWSGAAALTLFLACGAAVTAEDAPAAATPTPTTNAALERVVISRPDGTREIRWVPRANNSPNRAGTAAARLATQPAAGSGVQPRLTGGSPFGGPNVRISSPAFTGSVNAQGGLVYTPERSTAVGTSAPVRPAVYGAAGAMGDPGTFVGPQPVGGPSRPAPSTNPGALTPGGPGTPPNNPDPQDPGTPTPSDPQDPTPQDPDPRPPTGGGRVIVTGTVPSSAPPAPPPPPPPAPPAPEPTPPTGGGGSGGGSDSGDPDDAMPGAPAAFPMLLPGNGWSGPTLQPAPVGSPSTPGYDAKAIARWNVVPFQIVEDAFHVGVVAFHMNGIDRVEFSVEGGPWVPVYEMQLNPRTDVWEYTTTLDPSLLDDGLVELRARVWPNEAGEPRILAGDLTGDNAYVGEHSLVLNVNAGGSLRQEIRYVSPSGSDSGGNGTRERPFQSIFRAASHAADSRGDSSNATVYLLPGTYELGTYTFAGRFRTEHGWLTVEAAPGVAQNDVRIVGSTDSNGLRTDRVRFRNLRLQGQSGAPILRSATNPEAWLWLDNCRLVGRNRTEDTPWHGGFRNAYYTDLHVSDNRDGFQGGLMARNCLIEDIGSDAFSGTAMVLNCIVDGIDRLDRDFHPDVYQLFRPNDGYENLIIYGLHAYNANSQGIFARGLHFVRNSAFVNVLIELTNPVMLSQWRSPVTEHVLFWHVTHVNKPMWLRLDEQRGIMSATYHNVSIKGSVFDRILDETGQLSRIDIRHSHEIRGTGPLPGIDNTYGFPGFNDPDSGDYAPALNSPLRSRLPQSIVSKTDDKGQAVQIRNVGIYPLPPRSQP